MQVIVNDKKKRLKKLILKKLDTKNNQVKPDLYVRLV